MNDRFEAAALKQFASRLLNASGLPTERACVVAEILVEGDLFGHTTHGLALLGPYLDSIKQGTMTLTGEPEVINDRGPTLVWDGRYLPGPWLVVKAIELAESRLADHGVVSVAIRRSHHIACLQAYLKAVTDRGRMVLLLSSDSSVASVSPHGGLEAVYTPNPIAVGIPTDHDPILIDISASTTTNGLTGRLHKEGGRLPGPWVKDNQGRASDNPSVLFDDPPGTIMPLGGIDLGHKGFALGLLVEVMTSALAGYGRAENPDRWGASVFVQLLDPQAFGGLEAFTRESGFLAAACRAVRVPKGAPAVRLPGEGGLKRRAEQLQNGVEPHPGIMDTLAQWAEQLNINKPLPI